MSQPNAVLSDRLVKRLLNNQAALKRFPALKPYAKIHQAGNTHRRSSCCQSAPNEKEVIAGVKQFLLSVRKDDLEDVKAYMGLSSGSNLRVYVGTPGKKAQTHIL